MCLFLAFEGGVYGLHGSTGGDWLRLSLSWSFGFGLSKLGGVWRIIYFLYAQIWGLMAASKQLRVYLLMGSTGCFLQETRLNFKF
jgi:hypothetical protein